jgi:hypothetical protein
VTLTPETPSANEGERRHRAPAAPLAAVAGPLAFGLALIAIVLEAAQGPAGVNPGASESEIAIAYAHASGMLLWVGAYVQVFAYLCLGICLMSLATALRAGRAYWTEPLPGICAGLSLTYVALTLSGSRSAPSQDTGRARTATSLL